MNPTISKTRERDRQILALLAEGHKRSEIAKRLGVHRGMIDKRIAMMDSEDSSRVTAALEEASRKKGQLRDY